MSKKLTPAQRTALMAIESFPGKSGAFWRGLGTNPQTIASLEKLGMISAPVDALSAANTSRRQWRVTDLGRMTLDRDEKP